MSISFTGPKGWVEQRWIVYAMLRDNVQHHLEDGSPSGQFECVHAVAEVLGGKNVKISAKKLHAELERAQALLARPIDDLAISLRTRSVIALHWPPPDRRETILAKEWEGRVPMLSGTAETLDDVFGHLVEGLLEITDGASDTDIVDVMDL